MQPKLCWLALQGNLSIWDAVSVPVVLLLDANGTDITFNASVFSDPKLTRRPFVYDAKLPHPFVRPIRQALNDRLQASCAVLRPVPGCCSSARTGAASRRHSTLTPAACRRPSTSSPTSASPTSFHLWFILVGMQLTSRPGSSWRENARRSCSMVLLTTKMAQPLRTNPTRVLAAVCHLSMHRCQGWTDWVWHIDWSRTPTRPPSPQHWPEKMPATPSPKCRMKSVTALWTRKGMPRGGQLSPR